LLAISYAGAAITAGRGAAEPLSDAQPENEELAYLLAACYSVQASTRSHGRFPHSASQKPRFRAGAYAPRQALDAEHKTDELSRSLKAQVKAARHNPTFISDWVICMEDQALRSGRKEFRAELKLDADTPATCVPGGCDAENIRTAKPWKPSHKRSGSNRISALRTSTSAFLQRRKQERAGNRGVFRSQFVSTLDMHRITACAPPSGHGKTVEARAEFGIVQRLHEKKTFHSFHPALKAMKKPRTHPVLGGIRAAMLQVSA